MSNYEKLSQKEKEILYYIVYNKSSHLFQTIKKEIPQLLEKVLKYTNNEKFKNTSFSEKLYCYLNDYLEPLICNNENCKNIVKFKNFKNGYLQYCSVKCHSSSEKTKEQKKQTCLEKFGVICNFKSTETKEKIKQTNLKKYGFEFSSQSEIIKEKKKKTNLKKYGVECNFQSEIIKNKIKETNLEKYGFENPSQNEKIKEKKVNTFLKKYDETNILKVFKIREKIKQTNLKKYGFENPSKSILIKEKIYNTMLKKYKVKNINQKNITNYKNYNKEFIEKNFIKKELLNGYEFCKYYNLSYTNLTKYLKRLNILNYKNIKRINLVELKIYNYIYNLLIENKKIFEIKMNDKDIINCFDINNENKKLELDFYIELFKTNKDKENNNPYKKIAIEYNGLMFHSFGKNNSTKFNNWDKENLFFGKIRNKVYKNKDKHLLKTELCEEKEIKLFHIFENEWLSKNKQKIWKSIIKNELGLNEIKIYARDTYIKELKTRKEKEEKIKFLEENHLQSNIQSIINIGLYLKKEKTNLNNFKYTNKLPIKNKLIFFSELTNHKIYKIKKDELVSIMTFSKPRYKKNYKYELIRFCNLKNMNVIGAGSKILNYFKKEYLKENEKIISYGNRRWTNNLNNFYINNGFNFLEVSQINYYYFYKNENKLYHRSNFQKKRIKEYLLKNKKITSFSEELTETENMYNNGYRKIYDSGQLVFELIKRK